MEWLLNQHKKEHKFNSELAYRSGGNILIMVVILFMVFASVPLLVQNHQKPSAKIQTSKVKEPALTLTPSVTSKPTDSIQTKVQSTAVTITPTKKPENKDANSTNPNSSNTGGSNSSSNTTSTTTQPTPTNKPVSQPTSTPLPAGATVSTNSVSITMNRGETKNNVFSFTSTGATQFTLYGYPTSYGPGINWNPASGGMVSGQTVNVSLIINSNVPVGTYTGTGILKFEPGAIEKSVAFTITVIEAPKSAMVFTFSADSVNVTIKNGQSASVFTFTSTGSTAFSFPGYPTSKGPGINWGMSSGGISSGNTYTQTINIVNTPAGTYTGTGLFRDESSGAEKSIPVTVTIIE